MPQIYKAEPYTKPVAKTKRLILFTIYMFAYFEDLFNTFLLKLRKIKKSNCYFITSAPFGNSDSGTPLTTL